MELADCQGTRLYHSTHNNTHFKDHECLLSGIFHAVFSDYTWRSWKFRKGIYKKGGLLDPAVLLVRCNFTFINVQYSSYSEPAVYVFISSYYFIDDTCSGQKWTQILTRGERSLGCSSPKENPAPALRVHCRLSLPFVYSLKASSQSRDSTSAQINLY